MRQNKMHKQKAEATATYYYYYYIYFRHTMYVNKTDFFLKDAY